MHENRAKLFKDYFTVIFGSGLGRVLSFIIFLYLARSLGTEGFGIFSLFFTIFALAWQLPAVIDSAYVRYVRADSAGNKAAYLRAAFLIKAGIFIVLLLLSVPLGLVLGNLAFNKSGMALFAALAIISGGFLTFSSTLAAFFQAEELFFKFSALNVIVYLLMILQIILAYALKITLTTTIAIWINVIAALVIGLFSVLWLLKKIRPLFPTHKETFLEIVHFGKWLLATSVIYTIFQRLDILVLARFASFEALGVYSAAVRIAMLASLFTASVSAVLLPRGSSALTSLSHLKSYLRDSFTMSAGLILLIAVIIIISPFLISLLFGSQYSLALRYARILLLEPIFTVIYTPLMYLFYAQNKSRSVFELGIVMLVATIASLILLVPRYGPTGAAVSIPAGAFCGLLFVLSRSFKTVRKAYGYV